METRPISFCQYFEIPYLKIRFVLLINVGTSAKYCVHVSTDILKENMFGGAHPLSDRLLSPRRAYLAMIIIADKIAFVHHASEKTQANASTKHVFGLETSLH